MSHPQFCCACVCACVHVCVCVCMWVCVWMRTGSDATIRKSPVPCFPAYCISFPFTPLLTLNIILPLISLLPPLCPSYSPRLRGNKSCSDSVVDPCRPGCHGHGQQGGLGLLGWKLFEPRLKSGISSPGQDSPVDKQAQPFHEWGPSDDSYTNCISAPVHHISAANHRCCGSLEIQRWRYVCLAYIFVFTVNWFCPHSWLKSQLSRCGCNPTCRITTILLLLLLLVIDVD